MSVTRRSFALGLASLAGCGGRSALAVGGGQAADGGRAGDAALATSSDASACVSPLFDSAGLYNAAPAHRTLYTWTTAAQARELSSSRALYTRTADDLGRKGWLFDFLESVAARTRDPVAKVLTQPDFETGRYAWPFPWATAMGDEDYGRELVRIDLAEDALFVGVDASRTRDLVTYRAFDMNNAPVDVEVALAQPSRIAGIFFSNDHDRGGCDTVRGDSGYREFHLCHEATVVEWSLRTRENLDLIDDAHRRLSCFLGELRASGPLSQCTIFAWWTMDQPLPTADRDRFARHLAFGSDVGVEQVQVAISRLERSRFRPDPVRHRPNG